MKKCKPCGAVKADSDFYLKDGRPKGSCKACVARQSKASRAKHKEKRSAEKRVWYEANRERICAKMRAERRDNPDAVRARVNAYANKNRAHISAKTSRKRAANIEHWREKEKRARKKRYTEEYKEYLRQYTAANQEAVNGYKRKSRAAHPETEKASRQARRARELGAPGRGVTDAEWAMCLEAFDHSCAYCLRNDCALAMDHFRPLNLGGEHDPDNIVPACKSCNCSKGGTLIFAWLPRFERSGRLLRHAKVA